MKPLFIPLKTEYYEDFKNGTKRVELRLYGKRWNHQTCKVGRDVIVSKGYGKKNRMTCIIWKFTKQHGSLFGETYRNIIKSIYGTLNVEIAYIFIRNIREQEANKMELKPDFGKIEKIIQELEDWNKKVKKDSEGMTMSYGGYMRKIENILEALGLYLKPPPEVDGNKVPVDTKVLVSNDKKTWHNRYFSSYVKKRYHCFNSGATSWSVDKKELDCSVPWKYCKLASSSEANDE